jgi:hypothetical protein
MFFSAELNSTILMVNPGTPYCENKTLRLTWKAS